MIKISDISCLLIWTLLAPLNAQAAVLSPPPVEIIDAKDSADYIKNSVSTLGDTALYIHGQDHTLLDQKNRNLYVFGMDHKIYAVDLETNKTHFVAITPVMPGGAQFNPADPSKIIFCATRLEGHRYHSEAETGVYELDLAKSPAQVHLLLARVFKDQYSGRGEGVYYPPAKAPTISLDDLAKPENEKIRRKFGICDDVTVSKDGQRIYIAEPYQTSGGGFGDETSGHMNQREILMSSQNGKLWMFDRKNSKISLLATNFSFVDGIALEQFDSAGRETSILFTELAKYRLIRLNLRAESSEFQVLYKDLPGMPNSLTIDPNGRIFMAFNKMRTKILDILYNNPLFTNFFKEVALSLPSWLKPVPKETGFLVLSPNSKNTYDPYYYTVHDGSIFTSLISLSPDFQNNKIYLSIFDTRFRGIFQIPMPEKLKYSFSSNLD